MGNIALGAACALVFVLLPLFKGRGYRQLCFATTNIGFAFWYWLPAVRMLNVPPTDGTTADITQNSLNVSAWIVLAANIWAALFLITSHVVRARLLSSSGAMASLALAVCFLGSGTRSILLMGIFVVIAGHLVRDRSADAARAQRARVSALRYWYGVLALIILTTIGLALSVRFESAGSDSNFLIDAVLNNNDMLRELAFTESQLADYSSPNVIDFVLTPLTFILPSFLGFEKAIPDHLLYFNYSRAGIDLVLGQGNVFPGIIADFHMVFGALGPILFSVFLITFFYVAKLTSTLLPNPLTRLTFQITFLSYLFISFRNIQGALLLVLILGVVLIKLTARPAQYRRSSKLIAKNARMS